jgi:CubicO group peptidase (beta-lactamase class C family)
MFLFCLAMLAAAAAAKEPLPAPPAAFEPAAVEAYISQVARARGIPGLSVALARNGKAPWTCVYGQSSLAAGTPVTPDTVFALGSVTKQFTAACIFLLAQDGKLSVHDKVAQYYPNLTRAGDITLR